MYSYVSYPVDDNWWLGTYGNNQLNWSIVGNTHTRDLGHAIYDGRSFWIGDFNRDGKADVLFYYPVDDNTRADGDKINWSPVSNTHDPTHVHYQVDLGTSKERSIIPCSPDTVDPNRPGGDNVYFPN